MPFWKKKKKEDSPAFRRQMAEKIAGKHIKYVTERIDNEDIVIGREGSLCLRDGEMIVFASADILFRTPVDSLAASELMSLDGVILTGPDLEHGGMVRTVIAYYLYYR
ncbi:MAG: hypothetical protein IJX76_00580 [Clostridia bacterium]|nr:hypothetical protein [Clostridia bacterium]